MIAPRRSWGPAHVAPVPGRTRQRTRIFAPAQIPYFNGPIFLENKTQVGKVEEIFGPINASYFTIKMMDGVVATSYKAGAQQGSPHRHTLRASVCTLAASSPCPRPMGVKEKQCLHDGTEQSSTPPRASGDKFYISPDKLLPIERFTNPPPCAPRQTTRNADACLMAANRVLLVALEHDVM